MAGSVLASAVGFSAPASAGTCNNGVCASVRWVDSTTTSIHVTLTTTTPTEVYLFAVDHTGLSVGNAAHDAVLSTSHNVTVTGLHPRNHYTWTTATTSVPVS